MRMPMKMMLAALGMSAIGLSTQAAAQVTFYEGDGYRGRAFSVDGTVANFERTGFNDRAQSAVVAGGSWEVCEHAQFQGRCMILQPGNYASLDGIDMSRRISSVRPVAGPAPVAAPNYPPPSERLYEAQVVSVHAVGGPPEQRCWVERQQVHESGGANIPGAIVGGVIGGVLGHQIGGGRGKDVATARSWPQNETCGFRICPHPPSFPMMHVSGSPKRTAVSISIPFRPNAPSPAISSTRLSGWRSFAAIANGGPTPRQPNGPGSSQWPGR